jgi:hypothetical protein
MATAVVALAARRVVPLASSVLAVAAAVLFAAIAVLVVGRDVHTRPGHARAWWDAVTLAAAAGALAGSMHAEGDATAATGLRLLTIGTWLWVVVRPAPWAAGEPAVASGRRLLAVVATQSAVIAAPALARAHPAHVLEGAAVAVWAAALAVYVLMMVPVARGMDARARASSFRTDDWICMGAVAISVLAAAALLGTPGVPLRPAIRGIGLAAWGGACLWVALLVRLDVDAAMWCRPGLPTFERWSMVFPLGMFAVASQAIGATASQPVVTRVGRDAAWVALAAWVLVAGGALVRLLTRAPALRARVRRDSNLRPSA